MSDANQFSDLLPGETLAPSELAELARHAAARVDVDLLVRRDRDHRFCLQLWRDEHSEGWLLGWLDDQETGFHDHDSSAGGVYVLEGAVAEDRLSSADPTRRGSCRRARASRSTRSTSIACDTTAPCPGSRCTSTRRRSSAWARTRSWTACSGASASPPTRSSRRAATSSPRPSHRETGFRSPVAFGAPGSSCGLASVRFAHSRQPSGDPNPARYRVWSSRVRVASGLRGFAGLPSGS